MGLTGRISYVNRSAVTLETEGSVDYGLPPVRVGSTVVPARVAYVIEGDRTSPSARVEFEIRKGVPFCVGVHIEASEKGRSVKTGDFASIPGLDRLAVETFAELALNATDGDPRGAHIDRLDREAKKRAQREVRTSGDAELKRVAEVYLDHLDDRPLEAVEDALGLERRTASRRVAKAREKGYLPPSGRARKAAD